MLRMPPHRRLLARLASVTLLALSPLLAESQEPAASYRLGIFPYMAPRQTVELFGPVAASMQDALKRPVRLESAATFADFTRELAAGRYDIALIQPFDYPDAVEKYGYLPLARLDAPLMARLVVRDDSRFQKIEDLRGTTLALPPAESAIARMVLRALHDNRLVPGRDIKVRHFGSHDSCLQQVWTSAASACGTAQVPLLVFEKRMQAALRPIHDTPSLPHSLFVVHRRVPAVHRIELQALVTGWNQNEAGLAMLKNLGFPGLVVPKPAEYAAMRNYDPPAAAAAPAATADLTLGVFPVRSPGLLAQSFAPAQLALGKATGATVQLRTATSYDNFGNAVASASYDVVFVQPFDYAKAAAHGYLALAGMKERITGTFFVLEDSPYQRIADFRGKVVATPPADSAQSRLARLALAQAGIEPGRDVTIAYQKSQEACLQQVQGGHAVACATGELARTLQPKELTRGLRTLGRTGDVPGLLFMAHQRVPARTREQLQAEILGWKDSESGHKVLQAIGFGDFGAVDVADYQRLPRLEAGR